MDSFTYSIEDGKGGTATGIAVSVEVMAALAPENRQPAVKDDALGVQSPDAASLDPRENDVDPDGDPLTITTPSPAWAGGTVSCSETSCTATPKAGYGGTDPFSYTITDGRAGYATASVSVSVNRPPVAVDDAPSVYELKTVSFNVLNFGTADYDPDAEAVAFVSNTAAVKVGTDPAVAHGTVSCDPSGNCLYDPPNDAGGTKATFTYKIKDSRGNTDVGRATITIKETPISSASTSCSIQTDTSPDFAKMIVSRSYGKSGGNDFGSFHRWRDGTSHTTCTSGEDITLSGTSYSGRTLGEWRTLAVNQNNYKPVRDDLPADGTGTATLSYNTASTGPTTVFVMVGDSNGAARTGIRVGVKVEPRPSNFAMLVVSLDEYVVPG